MQKRGKGEWRAVASGRNLTLGLRDATARVESQHAAVSARRDRRETAEGSKVRPDLVIVAISLRRQHGRQLPRRDEMAPRSGMPCSRRWGKRDH
jgi:hypothetical protein